MTPDRIAQLIDRFDRSGSADLTVTEDGATLHLQKSPQVRRDPPPAAMLTATAIGHLRLTHPARAPRSFPCDVMAGEAVAYLQAGPLLRAVIAPRACQVGPPLLPEGTLVGYGTPVFALL